MATDLTDEEAEKWLNEPEDAIELVLSKIDENRLFARGFETGKLLNKGDTASVFRASCYKSPCVVKSIEDKVYMKYNELFMLKHIKHPHVVQLFALYVTTDQRLLIFMEFLEGGTMDDYLEQLKDSKKVLTEQQARHYYLQIADALRYMHDKGFTHGDLHENNVLLDSTKQICKLADFGASELNYDFSTGEIQDQGRIQKDIQDVGYLLFKLLKGLKSLSWQANKIIKVHLRVSNVLSFNQIMTTEEWLKMNL